MCNDNIEYVRSYNYNIISYEILRDYNLHALVFLYVFLYLQSLGVRKNMSPNLNQLKEKKYKF